LLELFFCACVTLGQAGDRILVSRSDEGARGGFIAPQHLAALMGAKPIALFLDVDGTLLALRPLPTDVRSDDALRRLMVALAARCNNALALVSGRTIVDLDRIFDPLVLPAAGMHGAELRFTDGVRHVSAPDLMDELRPAVTAFVSENQGLLFEDKGLTLCIHFRQRPELEAEVVAVLTKLTAGRDIVVQRGKMVAELKPSNVDKGRAIERIMATVPFAGRRPVFFGDDVTDESGFRYVTSVDGLGVRVGSLNDETSASLRLPDVDAVITTLKEICSFV
jgi:trehalose 6-phosphate phosphatase